MIPYQSYHSCPETNISLKLLSKHISLMTLYHGSYCAIQNPVLHSTRNYKDFGEGFYCTELLSQAERWAKRYETPVVNVFDYTPNPALNILTFSAMTETWLDFIVACRNGVPHAHDIVIGAMANDQVWNYIADFINGILTREQFWVLAKFKHPTHQVAFCTSAALTCLSFKESRKVSS
jgi:hypothetical protein